MKDSINTPLFVALKGFLKINNFEVLFGQAANFVEFCILHPDRSHFENVLMVKGKKANIYIIKEGSWWISNPEYYTSQQFRGFVHCTGFVDCANNGYSILKHLKLEKVKWEL